MATFGQIVRWTTFDGNVFTFELSGYSTVEEAKFDALRRAKVVGWTPPRWWQWWRRDDTTLKDLTT